jgi:hypothetical protein
MDRRSREFERVAEIERTTKEEAQAEGIGHAEQGIELPARSYHDETGVADFGVDEPNLAPTTRDSGEADPSRDPTGLFAGETEADRREEDEGRKVLEQRFPSTRGRWKESGAVPSTDHDQPE